MLFEQAPGRLHAQVAHVLVLRRAMLAAQAELLDEHVLGIPLASAISAAVIQRSGRYAALAATPTLTGGLEHAADDPLQLVQDALRHPVAVLHQEPAEADELAHAHQRPRGDLRVDVADLARLDRLAQRLDVALREPVVVVAEHLRGDELGLADDPVERLVLAREAEVRGEAEDLRLDAGRPFDDASFIAWRTRRLRSPTSSSKTCFLPSK